MPAVETLPACRFCGAPLQRMFLDLGDMPLANSYLTRDQLAGPEPRYPLRVRLCDQCLLVQADAVVTPEFIFNSYAYFSSYSSSWLEHAAAYSRNIRERLRLDHDRFVVEIASNDGYLLRNFVAAGIPCLGIEPAANVAEVAVANGVPTEVCFFGEGTAKALVEKHRNADLIVANNVLAHVPDVNDFVKGLKILLKRGGTITVEFPHVLWLMKNTEFDTIYHEHCSYLSLFVVEKIFGHHGLAVCDAETLSTHGGSLRLYACHDDDPRAAQPSRRLRELRRLEAEAGLDEASGYLGLDQRVRRITADFLAFLEQARSGGRKVAAYGAAAKGNTFLNACGLTAAEILFVADRNPHKQGCFLPGSHIPVVAPGAIPEHKPDYLLILPWNLEAEIRREWQGIAAWGGQFVTAIPGLRVWS